MRGTTGGNEKFVSRASGSDATIRSPNGDVKNLVLLGDEMHGAFIVHRKCSFNPNSFIEAKAGKEKAVKALC